RRLSRDVGELVAPGIENPYPHAVLLLEPCLDGGGDLQVDLHAAASARADGGARVDDQLAGLSLGAKVGADDLDLARDDVVEARVGAVFNAENRGHHRLGRRAFSRARTRDDCTEREDDEGRADDSCHARVPPRPWEWKG